MSREEDFNEIAINSEENESNEHESSSIDDNALQIEDAPIGDHVGNDNCFGELCGSKLKERMLHVYLTMELLEVQLKTEKENWKKLMNDLHLGEVPAKRKTTCNCKSSAVEKYWKELNERLNLEECPYVRKHGWIYCCHDIQYHQKVKDAQKEDGFTTKELIDIVKYRKNLRELEIMCDAELLNIKQSLNYVRVVEKPFIKENRKEQAAGDGEQGDRSTQEVEIVGADFDEDEYFNEVELPQILYGEEVCGYLGYDELMLGESSAHELAGADGTAEAPEGSNSSCNATDDGDETKLQWLRK